MKFFTNMNRLKQISVCLGILKGIISLALLTSIVQPDFKEYDKRVQGRKY